MDDIKLVALAVIFVISIIVYFICKYKNRSYGWILFINLSLMANKMYFIPLILIIILLFLPKLGLISKSPRSERMKSVSMMGKEEYVKKFSDNTDLSKNSMKDEWEKENNNI